MIVFSAIAIAALGVGTFVFHEPQQVIPVLPTSPTPQEIEFDSTPTSPSPPQPLVVTAHTPRLLVADILTPELKSQVRKIVSVADEILKEDLAHKGETP